MNQRPKVITAALLFGYFIASGDVIAEPFEAMPKTAEAIVAAYRSADLVDTRERAAADHRYALAQLTLAKGEVKRLIGEIEIEGAESTDIGGEVRAARMAEAAWQHAVETVAEHIVRLDSTFAER